MGLEKEQWLVLGIVFAFFFGIITGSNLASEPTTFNALSQLSPESYQASIDIVAVQEQGQAGVVSTATVEAIPGKGRVLISLNPFVEPDTQQSAETAAFVAQNFTGNSLANMDVIYSIGDTEASLVGGPSAGAALTIATIAAIEKKQVSDNVIVTGTILSDGSIGKIGGVIEKAAAAAEQGKSLFLVPKGQSVFSYYERQVVEEKRGSWTIQRTRYVPKELDLNQYSKEQGWNLEIKEVASIEEAARYMLH